MERINSLDHIKSFNRSLVLDTIRFNQPISRAELAKKTGFSRSTISSIIDELMLKEFVVEVGLGESTSEGGRRGIQLGFNPKSAFGVGVDIGEDGILYVISDLEGHVEFEKKNSITSNLEWIVSDIQTLIMESGIDQKKILGIGIAVPSLVENNKEVVINAPTLGWYNLNVRKALSQKFPFPIYVNNDVDCRALGERWCGVGSQSANMIYMSIGTGIGGSIIANGQLIQGYQFSAGEIGLLIDKEDFESPINGRFGPFERKITTLIEEFKATGIAPIELIENLSIAIVNLVNLLNPEKIVIGGVDGPILKELITEIRDNVERFSPLRTSIEIACLGEHAQALGALWYLFNQTVFN